MTRTLATRLRRARPLTLRRPASPAPGRPLTGAEADVGGSSPRRPSPVGTSPGAVTVSPAVAALRAELAAFVTDWRFGVAVAALVTAAALVGGVLDGVLP